MDQWQQQWNSGSNNGPVAATMDQNDERRHVPILLPKTGAEAQPEAAITPQFTALITGHGTAEAYRHTFKLADDLMCHWQQTSDHITLQCNIIVAQTRSMIKQITVSGGPWPPAKNQLITNHLQAFLSFVKSTDFLN
jgi:hypothetical protein